ncbi:uncharacterized protein TNCV_4247781 [Trichonephila clavipes]|nr:uncharacterized protein TNCV_4247781 [Trichonephila clavipes]
MQQRSTLQKLLRAIQNKRRCMLSAGVVLLHDNARPHTANRTQELVTSFGWEQLDHPLYSPDLAPNDYLFPLADGAKQSFSLRGKNGLRIFTLRLTGGAHRYHCSRRKQKPTSDINKALTGGARRTSLSQSPGDQSRGFSTADSHWLGTRAYAVLAISLRCQSMFRTATAGSDVVQSGRPIFDDFFQHLWPYIGNNTANVVFQMVKRLWLIRIDP